MSLQAFAIIYCIALIVLMLAAMWIERRITRKRWPEGHNHASYWGGARRVSDE